jgi:ribosomal protein S18 acetylase RimI-like enzyme
VAYLPSNWQTDRLAVRDGSLAEIAELRELFNTCHHLENWDPTFILVSTEEMTQLVAQSVNAPAAGERQFRLQTARPRGDLRIIGYFHTYQRQPHPDVAFISMMVIHRDFQGSGYGRELVTGLWQQLRLLGWCRAVWLHVYLRNLPALRFWISQGFTTIVDYEDDKAPAETAHANLTLAKLL